MGTRRPFCPIGVTQFEPHTFGTVVTRTAGLVSFVSTPLGYGGPPCDYYPQMVLGGSQQPFGTKPG